MFTFMTLLPDCFLWFVDFPPYPRSRTSRFGFNGLVQKFVYR
jgi:hypothetical protein